MEPSLSPVEIKTLPLSTLVPNPWNPNRMEKDKLMKLKAEIKARGLLVPILVRPRGGSFEIVDGEHRWRLARELGLSEVPCVVTRLSATEARVKTLQLNGLRGENDPDKLADLLADLTEKLSGGDMAKLLPWTAEELEQMLSLALAEAKQEMKTLERRRQTQEPGPEVYAALVTPQGRQAIDAAVQKARSVFHLNDDGEALTEIARRFVHE